MCNQNLLRHEKQNQDIQNSKHGQWKFQECVCNTHVKKRVQVYYFRLGCACVLCDFIKMCFYQECEVMWSFSQTRNIVIIIIIIAVIAASKSHRAKSLRLGISVC